ncbi:hypothetical protein [Bradyrhizobium prioriisuperbiae]|jgi:hypothetical protein|uniref:hypothetical protein n=1 Tax=Bradyrhizobium prioriisuperbiae TaxID=2854389 RepID=UPI0028E307C7|nr:hypothetical protein [Bradyrhizobium prioritasuperba]
MSRLITAIFILSLASGGAAIAQSGGTSAKSGGLPQAPVGHRQPTKADVSKAESKDNRGLLGADAAAADKELDRKIKNICRGC